MIVRATYTSVWDGGVALTSECGIDLETKEVTCDETFDAEGLDALDRQYVTLEDGTELDVLDSDEGFVLSDEDIALVRSVATEKAAAI